MASTTTTKQCKEIVIYRKEKRIEKGQYSNFPSSTSSYLLSERVVCRASVIVWHSHTNYVLFFATCECWRRCKKVLRERKKRKYKSFAFLCVDEIWFWRLSEFMNVFCVRLLLHQPMENWLDTFLVAVCYRLCCKCCWLLFCDYLSHSNRHTYTNTHTLNIRLTTILMLWIFRRWLVAIIIELLFKVNRKNIVFHVEWAH